LRNNFWELDGDGRERRSTVICPTEVSKSHVKGENGFLAGLWEKFRIEGGAGGTSINLRRTAVGELLFLADV